MTARGGAFEVKTGEAIAVVGIAVTLVGVVAAPFVVRYVRTLGKVRCVVESWYPQRTGSTPYGSVAEERRLVATFSNGKDVPVAVSGMRVEFYKGGRPLEDWTRPAVEFVDEHDRKQPLGLVNVPPRELEQRTISVTPGRDDIVRGLQQANRAVFVATIEGVGDERVELTPPW